MVLIEERKRERAQIRFSSKALNKVWFKMIKTIHIFLKTETRK